MARILNDPRPRHRSTAVSATGPFATKSIEYTVVPENSFSLDRSGRQYVYILGILLGLS